MALLKDLSETIGEFQEDLGELDKAIAGQPHGAGHKHAMYMRDSVLA